MAWFIYENWQAGPRKAVIHSANCPYCNGGLGRSNGGYGRAHAKWHGPYGNVDIAREAQRRMQAEPRECGYCMKRSD